MHQPVEREHQLRGGWQRVFNEFGKDWPDRELPWAAVRMRLFERMTGVADAPPDTALDALFSWLDNEISEDARRGLVEARPREALFRRLLATADTGLQDLFMALYLPLDGDVYWNDQFVVVFRDGRWHDSLDQPAEQAAAGTPLRPGPEAG